MIIHFAAYFYAVSVVFGTQCALPYLVILFSTVFIAFLGNYSLADFFSPARFRQLR